MYSKPCPSCNKEIVYARKDALVRALRKNTLCMSCKATDEWKKKPKIPNEIYLENRRVKAEEAFKEKATKIHKNLYDYSKVKYKNINEKVEIVCRIHGSFWHQILR